MRPILPIFLCLCANTLTAQTTLIPDPNFEQYLIDEGYDTGTPDGSIPTLNIDGITELYIQQKSITDLAGIEDFAALKILRCDQNQLTTLDLSQNTELMWLLCSNNQLTSLDVSGCPNLYYLVCEDNLLTSLDLGGNGQLEHFSCRLNGLTTLNLASNPGITYLNCSQNTLTNLNLAVLPVLGNLVCNANQLTSIDLSQNPVLVSATLNQNQLTALDISDNPFLGTLHCANNQLQCLNVRNGKNSYFNYFNATGNSSLGCIEVDDSAWAEANWMTNVDPGASFSNLCGNACSSNQLSVASETKPDLHLYPNPAEEGRVFLGTTEPGMHYRLFNSAGQEIRSGQPDEGAIQLDEIPAGLYILLLTDTEGQAILRETLVVR